MKQANNLIKNINRSNLSKQDKKAIVKKLKDNINQSTLSKDSKKKLVNKLKGDAPDMDSFLMTLFQIVKIGSPLVSLFFHDYGHD